ncbi:MAG: hypothetical protein H6833_00325 [Planctomycetes bacterium]|nr:hypothetical protein [Planctomycetota bacterium]
MNAKHLAAVAALLSASSLSAQTAVSPAEFAKTEAPTYDYRPFGSNNANGYRQIQIHDDLKGKKLTINELGFRRDAREGRYSAFEFTTTIVCSTAAIDAPNISTTFDTNHGTNKKSVAISKTIKWPAQLSDDCASTWDYRIKFDSPYAFDGTNGGFCWEAQVALFRNIATTVYFDFANGSSTNPAMAQSYYGTGCVHSQQVNRANLTTSTSMNWAQKTGTVRVNFSYLGLNGLAIGAIGFNRDNFGPIPLPLLIPGSATAYSGPCSFYTTLDLLFATATSSTGAGNISIPIPADINYGGIKLFVQMMSVDDATPAAIKFITTNGAVLQYVPPYTAPAVSRVIASSSLAPTGSLQKNYGMVTAIF